MGDLLSINHSEITRGVLPCNGFHQRDKVIPHSNLFVIFSSAMVPSQAYIAHLIGIPFGSEQRDVSSVPHSHHEPAHTRLTRSFGCIPLDSAKK